MSLVINGHLSPKIIPTRGVKQGDPHSSLLFLMTIEPLGNLLRSHEEHGININERNVATSLFFADDSTLLSGTRYGAVEQLQLVQTDCQGSGAKLNLAKSTQLLLNRHQEHSEFMDIQVLKKMDSVKYLGIPFSQSSVDDLMMGFLEKRYYDGFRSWFRRARNVNWRLLVAQTMVLSRL